MQVYINKYAVDETTKRTVRSKERQIVDAQLVSENKFTIWVKLPDGHIIKRKKDRDIYENL